MVSLTMDSKENNDKFLLAMIELFYFITTELAGYFISNTFTFSVYFHLIGFFVFIFS